MMEQVAAMHEKIVKPGGKARDWDKLVAEVTRAS